MKRKSTLFLAILLVLFIAPVIFGPFTLSPAIPTQQNMSKDFAISADWFDTSWLYRKNITIDGATGAGVNYQVMVEVDYDSDMQTDFDDIRFTDNDNVTELDYWRETYTASTNATFWVKVTDSLETSALIYMYYGNSGVSTTSNGTATFEFYEDWTSETIGAQWTLENTAGSVSFDDTDANHGSVIKVDGNAGMNTYSFYSDNDYNKSYALRMRAYHEKTVSSYQSTKQGWNDVGALGQALLESYQGAARIVIRDDGGTTDHQNIGNENFDSWHVFDSLRGEGATGVSTKWYTDGALVATGNNDPDALGYHVYVYVRDSEYDVYNDWFVVRRYLRNGPAVNTIGAEQLLYPPAWSTVDSAEINYLVPYDEWSLNVLLFLCGCVMVPTSTAYLFYGGTSAMNKDKFFYGLIAFLLGWGLIFTAVVA